MGDRVAEQVEGVPAVPLRPYVRRYVGYALSGFPAGLHLGVPTPALTAVISLAEPLDLTVLPGTLPHGGHFGTVTSGLTSRSVVIRHDGTQRGLQIEVTPFAARVFYGMPAAALVDTLVPWDDLLQPQDAGLVERLATAPSWTARFAIVDEVLLRSMSHRVDGRHGLHRVRPEVAEMWRRVVSSRGRVEIGTVARDLGWSRRHLSTQFRQEIGLTPKVTARLARFEHAHRLAIQAEPPSWADVAATAGYTDQAHLVREWREHTGRPPTVWRRDDVLVDLEG